MLGTQLLVSQFGPWEKSYDKIVEALLDVSLVIEVLKKEKVHSKGNSKLI